ncbi:MAG: plasmid stabilization system-related protein [Candidatus Jorgensenbacteria bacterium GW2011_GWA1_48_13]|uniref:Plasmid stabilization system-related protein n=2 Tax=Candidatus Joergenseniibacteriota TaxID=1752739 RepID=A0A0G1W9X8_9BACT|nr:MAG: plasmid stabilization system-related protein [Candidatus Jorgensenbacteria bacterium GW2011_GWA1_48_13]KKU99215.1 MAG: plasmid stabilization system-related protein [Candidatus Jorgensenbacteria bacterium GW2011_GWC1_48_8]KKW15410.1 MAG: plasmid stabilization system-related protein [Candidatus Jorgensenbacteria bacterium GW2011_GWB1_50_10]
MDWVVKLTEDAQKDLNTLDGKVRGRILEKLKWISENFDDITPLPLTGEFTGFYKLRVGDWRVFYKVDWAAHIIFAVYIGHRDSAYR